MRFEKKEVKPNVLVYDFEDASVGIDTTGKNYKELPEIVFGIFDKEKDRYSMDQPKVGQGIPDMDYIAECIREVSRDSGISEFWFYPYGKDGVDGDRREAARLRLFQRFGSITKAPGGHGYILKV